MLKDTAINCIAARAPRIVLRFIDVASEEAAIDLYNYLSRKLVDFMDDFSHEDSEWDEMNDIYCKQRWVEVAKIKPEFTVQELDEDVPPESITDESFRKHWRALKKERRQLEFIDYTVSAWTREIAWFMTDLAYRHKDSPWWLHANSGAQLYNKFLVLFRDNPGKVDAAPSVPEPDSSDDYSYIFD